jgi:hypothetical protein
MSQWDGPSRRLSRPWTAEDDDRLRQLVTEGGSRHAIAVQLGRTDESIARRVQEIQIELKVRPRGHPKSVSDRQQRPSTRPR